METKRKKNVLFKILGVLLFIYIALMIAYESGYYETKMSNRATLTKEAMEQFEADLAKGEAIDIKQYLKEERVDYSNAVTKIGNKITQGIGDAITKGIAGIFDTLKGLFW